MGNGSVRSEGFGRADLVGAVFRKEAFLVLPYGPQRKEGRSEKRARRA